MGEWKEYKLGDVAEIVGGGTPKTKITENWNGNIAWLTPRDLSNFNGRFITNGERNISELGLKSSSAKLLPKNTVLLSSRAPVGYLAISLNEISTNQGFRSLIPNSKTHYLFLFYMLKNNIDYLKSQSTGTTFGELAGSTLKSLSFLLPPLPEQKAIASVLSSLDDKIDLLHRQNKTLEAMAETLYDSWVVESEFESTIKDLIDVQNGFAFKSKSFQDNGNHRVVKIKNISGGIVDIQATDFVSDNIISSIDARFVINTGDILFAMTGAKIGKMGVIPQTEKSLWLNQRVGLFKEKFKGARFLAYLHLKSDLGLDYIENTATGSAQPNISGVGIEKCEFPKFTKQQLTEYSEQLYLLFSKVIFNLGQIRTLEKLRDTLLPKLMSGEVRVEYEN